jgi:hypothetical protein
MVLINNKLVFRFNKSIRITRNSDSLRKGIGFYFILIFFLFVSKILLINSFLILFGFYSKKIIKPNLKKNKPKPVQTDRFRFGSVRVF